jgi:hypothetical protein
LTVDRLGEPRTLHVCVHDYSVPNLVPIAPMVFDGRYSTHGLRCLYSTQGRSSMAFFGSRQLVVRPACNVLHLACILHARKVERQNAPWAQGLRIRSAWPLKCARVAHCDTIVSVESSRGGLLGVSSLSYSAFTSPELAHSHLQN